MNIEDRWLMDCVDSVLPMLIEGSNQKINEIIVCDSISGGSQYIDKMPSSVSLVRSLRDGTEYRANYIHMNYLEKTLKSKDKQRIQQLLKDPKLQKILFELI